MGVFDRVANWFDTKSSAVTAAVVGYWGSGSPVWTPANYEALARDGYTKCSWAFRAIEKTATACGAVPWILYRVAGDGSEELLDAHPLLDLLQSPNDSQAWPRIVANLVAFRQIAGNGYLEATGDNPERPPFELFTLRPDRMNAVVGDAQHRVRGWEYNLNGQIIDLPGFQVLQWAAFHPIDDWYGLSPLQVAARGIDQFNAAQAANVYLQQNMARPSGVLSSPKQLGDRAYDRLKADIAANWTGSRNRAKPLLLEDGLTWQQIALNPVELDFIESSKMTAEQIVVTLGVPWVLLSPTDTAFANMATARRVFYEDTVVPLLNDLAAELNRWLVPRFAGRNERLRLVPDWDTVEALQENRDAAYKRAGDAYRSQWMLRLNEAREAIGWGADEQHGERYAWEVEYLLRWGQWPATTSAAAQKSITVQARQMLEPGQTTDDPRVDAYKAQERKREPWYEAVRAQILKRFDAERQAVMLALKSSNVDAAADTIQATLADQRAEWEKTLTAAYLAVGEAFASEQLLNLKHGARPGETKAEPVTREELERLRAAILAYITEHGPARSGFIQSTTGRALIERTREIQTAGGSARDLMLMVDQVYSQWMGTAAIEAAVAVPESPRVELIATTETVNASEVGRAAGADASGLPLIKEWQSTQDHRVRDTHRAADGQVVPRSEPFTVGGFPLMHPGDSSLGAPASVTSRCRCFVIYDLAID